MEHINEGNIPTSSLEKIVEWAERLPPWQSDAIRRLLTQGELSETDKAELMTMLKQSYGLTTTNPLNLQPKPIRKGQISGVPIEPCKIILKAMKIISNINAIPDNSNLPFGHQGLTVIYGQNASGKSGYARVLKRACNSRDISERILPNIFNKTTSSTAQASFKISNNGSNDKEVIWIDGKETDPLLANICVFDHKCARVIVDDNNEMSYLPYGSDVFEKLISLIKLFRNQLENEKPKIQKLEYTDIPLVTSTGKFVNEVTYKTSLKDIEQACKWTEEDEQHLTQLNKQIAEAEAHNPLKQAKRLRNLKLRIDKLIQSIKAVDEILSATEIKNLQLAIENLSTTEKALAVASKISLANEPLPGAGEDVWQKLYNAAKAYSVEKAYPGKDFPVIDDSGLCVLCMQPLTEDAKERLRRFKNFMEKTIKQEFDNAVTKLNTMRKLLEDLQIATSDDYIDVIDEVESHNKDLAKTLKEHILDTSSRRMLMIKSIKEKSMSAIVKYKSFPVQDILNISDALEKKATEVEKTADNSIFINMKSQQVEILARKLLHKRKDSVKMHVEQLIMVNKYNQCIAATDFRSITDKAKDILVKTLTPQLQKALAKELEALNANHIPLCLKASGREGEPLHKMELTGKLPFCKANLTEILSEGEQHVVAIAGFLAELKISNPLCPIVLDDPVCSLDHIYREKIARRLVKEASTRQVIVFTHDIAFLLELESRSSETGGYFLPQTISREGGRPGFSTEKKPWHTMSVKERLSYLDSLLNEFKSLYETNTNKYNEKAAKLYGRLRESWEAVVEEVLFHGVIIRHGSEVKTLQLRYVTVTDDDYKSIFFGMGKCSEWMIGHDKSRSLDENRPSPKEINQDIQILREFVKTINKQQLSAEEKRNKIVKAIEPPSG